MQKKLSHLKKNSSLLNLRLAESVYLDRNKEQRVQLPKINKRNHQDSLHKSPKELITELETYLQGYEGQVKGLLHDCLQALKMPHMANKPLSKQSSQKPILSSICSNIEWGKDSQVLNFRRAKLQKVQSRELFQKMRLVKYQQDPSLSRLSEREVITLLRGKINDKENTITKLHQQLEQMRKINEQLGFSLKVYQESQAAIAIQNEMLEEKTIRLNEEIEELRQKQAENQLNSVSIEKYEEQSAKCEHLGKKLKEREDELIALWQTSLVARTHFPI